MPFVFSDTLRNDILKMYKEAEIHATNKGEKEVMTKLIKRIELMPKWKPGALYSKN